MADETPKENPSSQEPSASSQFDTLKKKVQDVNANPKIGILKRFFSHHMREAISGALVLFGIIADFVSWVGGLFVACGIVLGFYPELQGMLKNLQIYYAKNGPAKNALLCGLLLFFLINVFPFTVAFIVLCLILVLLSSNNQNPKV
ncbi:hypothetical protein CP10139811_0663 [Chlamydia ibidis]|uniref:Uncharacterized protein n=2 Tax=Chlamydia ibidis TaxID=1405396 RepID=S7KJI4_9CHLA|nr:hypothetical protein [Chlamydia ibidis]EPP34595.1 hypothetical protein CP10139811_0663 [Chlamydia ibidis]EQM62269.1 putative inner membrane protein [Chlamydia ibidis 10-1398/6]